MAYKYIIYSGEYEGFFRGNFDKKKSICQEIQQEEYFDIELIDFKKFEIHKIIESDDVETYYSKIKSIHNRVNDVETYYPNEEHNPKNKSFGKLVINNPIFPKEFLSKESDKIYYGKIEGQAIYFESKWVEDDKREINKEAVIPTKVEYSQHTSKGCYESRFDDDGILSSKTPLSETCFKSNSLNRLFYPRKTSCYGCGSGCFNAQPNLCFGSSCFGCFNGCFQIPLIRAIFNILGIIGLLYLLLLLLCNLNLSSTLIPKIEPEPENQDEIIVEDIPVEEENIIEPIEDSETTTFSQGDGNNLFVRVGDFDVQDNDRINLFFNDQIIKNDYELTNTPIEIELRSLLLNQINTLRIEATSNGDKGVCTPMLDYYNICQGDKNSGERMRLNLKSQDPNKKFGEIYFFIEGTDCLENYE